MATSETFSLNILGDNLLRGRDFDTDEEAKAIIDGFRQGDPGIIEEAFKNSGKKNTIREKLKPKFDEYLYNRRQLGLPDEGERFTGGWDELRKGLKETKDKKYYDPFDSATFGKRIGPNPDAPVDSNEPAAPRYTNVATRTDNTDMSNVKQMDSTGMDRSGGYRESPPEGYLPPEERVARLDRNKFQEVIFKKLGGNPLTMDPEQMLNEAEKSLPQEFRRIFKGRIPWARRDLMNNEERKYWERAKSEFLKDKFAESKSKIDVMEKQYSNAMTMFDKMKAQEEKRATEVRAIQKEERTYQRKNVTIYNSEDPTRQQTLPRAQANELLRSGDWTMEKTRWKEGNVTIFRKDDPTVQMTLPEAKAQDKIDEEDSGWTLQKKRWKEGKVTIYDSSRPGVQMTLPESKAKDYLRDDQWTLEKQRWRPREEKTITIYKKGDENTVQKVPQSEADKLVKEGTWTIEHPRYRERMTTIYNKENPNIMQTVPESEAKELMKKVFFRDQWTTEHERYRERDSKDRLITIYRKDDDGITQTIPQSQAQELLDGGEWATEHRRWKPTEEKDDKTDDKIDKLLKERDTIQDKMSDVQTKLDRRKKWGAKGETETLSNQLKRYQERVDRYEKRLRDLGYGESDATQSMTIGPNSKLKVNKEIKIKGKWYRVVSIENNEAQLKPVE